MFETSAVVTTVCTTRPAVRPGLSAALPAVSGQVGLERTVCASSYPSTPASARHTLGPLGPSQALNSHNKSTTTAGQWCRGKPPPDSQLPTTHAGALILVHAIHSSHALPISTSSTSSGLVCSILSCPFRPGPARSGQYRTCSSTSQLPLPPAGGSTPPALPPPAPNTSSPAPAMGPAGPSSKPPAPL